ncbi:hypothetical protein [Streptomyces sp. NPDC048606]|uniref:hypothetical protein n=1 Tax=Streptomyces sp. NPDC048606 TaxID=3154726 RepID=UPI00341B9D37
MLAFNVSIYIPNPEQAQDPKNSKIYRHEKTLASWTTPTTGVSIGWLDELERQGKAEEVLSSGYPVRFTAHARDVLPLLAGGSLFEKGSTPFLKPELIAACPEDELLFIDAWDQS